MPSFLSLFYLILLLSLGSAIILAELVHHNPHSHVHGLLTVLMLVSSTWMLWFAYQMHRRGKPGMYKDQHAGAVWLKGGLALFALATLVLDCFHIGHYWEILHCASVFTIMYPFVQAIFTLVQVLFLSFHAKVSIQHQPWLNRLGLMHTLATNILAWMNAVLDESIKQLKEIKDFHKKENLAEDLYPGVIQLGTLQPENGSANADSCICTTELCHIFHETTAYLYPFNIEFSLFSSAMLYIMWKNTGRIKEQQRSTVAKKNTFQIHHGIIVGPIFGALALAVTFAVMISFGVLVRTTENKFHALKIYYLFNAVLLSLMSVASGAGMLMYKFHRDNSYSGRSKNIVRSLDITILLASSCGPLMASVFSAVASVVSQSEGVLKMLDLCFSLCKIIQLLGQDLFIAEGLHSAPNVGEGRGDWSCSVSQQCPNDLMHKGSVNEAFDSESGCVPCSGMEGSLQNLFVQSRNFAKADVKTQNMLPNASNQLTLFTSERERNAQSTRQKILRNIISFLLLSNISLWILYAFGTRPHLVRELEQNFYGFTSWVVIVNITLPLGIFYRMHSVAGLFEVYCAS
ncbi:proton channel OTOP2-like [Callorhinchus milii]|uniref:proton channel OTOP2-like n=1 Tax=Callorhinchus milii TaxID=7868 RepID=UPI000457259E|nr:proton channel OTOP2-like [Callorhinchus milii]|eukprot:gi/632970782/ref/XP_007901838.1/ PREDICTED: otopetrin-2-like [Callorhinchus milii]